MINPSDVGQDEDLAREVLIVGRSIAPCLDGFETGGEQWKDAVAILSRVYQTAVDRGSMLVKSQSIGPASVTYQDVRSAFDGQPRAALKALCPAAASGMPKGSFPEDRPVIRLWPEC